ncbi:MAG: RpiB/LacA/LacB family sugar-phosphate isomerase [Actinomycetales bacterium]|nr:MAG: RpiB/LacA/LacB family sugar-phosphate isomerase [Actinomycetales bacterium]
MQAAGALAVLTQDLVDGLDVLTTLGPAIAQRVGAEDDVDVALEQALDDRGAESQGGEVGLAVVIGGSGNGEQIAANKVKGARAALAWSVETAQLARQHNNAQVVSVGARMHPVEEVKAIIEAFLTTPWSEADRHQRRIDLLAEYEATGTFS